MRIESFDFWSGRVLSGRYEVISLLGTGYEGEVYLVRERATGIERAAKFFFPHRNPNDRAARMYANKLHKLRHCPIVIQYHSQDSVRVKGVPVTFLVSDFVEGELFSEFLKRQPGGRLQPFSALHFLHALSSGMECVHHSREYHGDLHGDNIIVGRYGLGFELKLLDVYHWKGSKRDTIQFDVVEMVRTFYEALGGSRYYARQPPEIKAICCGLKRSLILKKFRTAGELKSYLETMEWG